MEQQEIPPTVSMVPVEEPSEQEQTAIVPTKSVKNFWERLDEVFTQTSGLRDKLDEIVDQFPTEAKNASAYRSFIFQPERISITSNEDIFPSVSLAERNIATSGEDSGHQIAETFSEFRVRFQKSLINVKSLQLLSCVIPNAIQNIPNYSVCFFYYKIRNVTNSLQGAWNSATVYSVGDFVTFLGNTFVCIQGNQNYQPVGGQLGVWWNPVTLPTDGTRPNYFDLDDPQKLGAFYLVPTFGDVAEALPVLDEPAFNRSFTDYADLVTSLNVAQNSYAVNLLDPNDVQFTYDQTLNKIQMIPNAAQIAAGYYYMPAGYEDPRVTAMKTTLDALYPNMFRPGYTLNLRCGFTWNGIFPDPIALGNPWGPNRIVPPPPGYQYQANPLVNSLYWYMRPADPVLNLPWSRQIVTANSYPDLVNTACVKIYADVALGSAEEGQVIGQQQQTGLLSIVPVNTTNLGVGFYQNNFNNPLTKVPPIISEIGIRLVNDQGLPFVLPNSATVLLELGITYH